jgi:DNA transformation protein and related proteins
MAASNGFLDLLRELLSPVGTITIKRMFGGASVYADGVLFALIDDDVLYLKGDDATAARFDAEGLGKFTYDGKTGPVSMSYWRAPERLYDDPEEMAEWAREALAAARRAKSKPASKKKSGTVETAPPNKSKPTKSRKA